MSGDKLSRLQWRILRVLSRLDPPGVLIGGAALAGVYLKHRHTRDLDLLWCARPELGRLAQQAEQLLSQDGLQVELLQRAPSFHRVRVSDGTDTCVVDLVAQPAPLLAPPVEVQADDAAIRVEDRQEILVDKLCALLGRSELRDLQDVKALLDAGADLAAALASAPQKDTGFSVLTLAWVLKDLQPRILAQALDWPDALTAEIVQFQGWLIDRLVALSAPVS